MDSAPEVWSGETNVTDQNKAETSKGPALAFYNDVLHMVYRDDDSNIFYCTFDSATSKWLEPKQIKDPSGIALQTSLTPGLAAFKKDTKSNLYMAYRGNDEYIYYAFLSGEDNKWYYQNKVLSDAKTKHSPALAVYDNKLYMVYAGYEGSTLWSCYFDDVHQTWIGQTNITDLNSSKTQDGPALAAYDDKLYLIYRGTEADEIWCCYYDAAANTWFGGVRLTQENKKGLTGPQTSRPVSLEIFKGKLYMVFRAHDCSDIRFQSFDKSRWSDELVITEQNGAKTSEKPGLAAVSDRLYTVYRGASTSKIYSCFLV